MTTTNIEIPAFRSISNGKAFGLILLLSAVVFAFLVWLIYFKPAAETASRVVGSLDKVNASLNSISTILLILGYRAIRQRRFATHMKFMFGALASSALFFVCYVIYHNFHGDTKFLGTGLIRPIYFLILISHIVLSGVSVPLILTSFYLSLAGRLPLHRKVSKWTFPIWLYVSVTGVLIFVMTNAFNP